MTITRTSTGACSDYNCRKDHTGHLRNEAIQLVLVGTGSQAYVWVGESDDAGGAPLGTLSGRDALRSFAQQILDATAPRARRTAKATDKP